MQTPVSSTTRTPKPSLTRSISTSRLGQRCRLAIIANCQSLLLAVLLLIASHCLSAASFAQDDTTQGGKLYQQHCASCHGVNGEGKTDEFPDPLFGDLAPSELAKYIDETMPEQDPALVEGDDAKQVAAFVFENFYSEAARIKANKPRIELARLTVPQYRNRIADIIASFNNPVYVSEDRGLKASYYADRHSKKSRLLANQVDPRIDFPNVVPHFDPTGKYESIAKPKKKPANRMSEGFSVNWRGSLLTPETGWYEIKVKTKNGFQLFLNDSEKALIDREVRSDEVVDHQAKIYLLAGRLYDLKLDFFSYPDPPAKVQLLWTPPHQPEQVIPGSQLRQQSVRSVLCVSTQFPADDASTGYDRGVDVSREWDEATTRGALEAAEWISDRIEPLAGFRFGDEKASERARAFCEKFTARAFVTRLSDEDKQFYVGQHFDADLPIPDQVKRVVLMTLKSPRFLYPDLEKRDKAFRLAASAAMVMWDSVPNKNFLGALYRNDQSFILEPKKRRDLLKRMIELPAARRKLNAFFEAWLTSYGEDGGKNEERFPEFDEQLVADLKTSLLNFASKVAWSERSDYRELFQADYLLVNQHIASYYDLAESGSKPNRPGFFKVDVDPEIRSGIVSHPYLMSALAYHQESSPIHRGVFVAKKLLGRRLRQPPNNVKPLTEEFAPEMTTRERVEHQTKEPTCMSCHSVINPLGFSLENFDADGQYRKRDGDKPINAETVYRSPNGSEFKLGGPRDLANYLATDESAQKNFIRQLFRFYTKCDVTAYGEHTLDELHAKFAENGYRIRDLIVEIGIVAMANKE